MIVGYECDSTPSVSAEWLTDDSERRVSVRVFVPNANNALVAPEKAVRYLLVPEHPQNGGKAAFFFRFGFTRTQWEMLAAALAEHVQTYEVEQIIPEPGRTKDTVVGPLRTPDDRNPLVRTVWQTDVGSTSPRFITACPQEAGSAQ